MRLIKDGSFSIKKKKKKKTQNLELVNLKCVTYAQLISLSLTE